MQNESTPDARGPVFCGVDTHADSHWLYVLDWRGRKVLSRQFPADAAGYEALAGAIAAAGEPACIAMEGTSIPGADAPARDQEARGRLGARGGQARGEGQPGEGGVHTGHQREVHLDAGEGPKGAQAHKEGLRGMGRGRTSARLGQASLRGRAQNGF